MASRDLNALDFLSLYVGGEDGSKRQDASDAGTDECNMIEIMVDGTTFSLITATNAAGGSFNMLTTNNLTAKVFNKGKLLLAPAGGYITAYTASEETEFFKMITSDRKKQVS